MMNDKYLHSYVIILFTIYYYKVIRYKEITCKNNDFEKKIFIFLILFKLYKKYFYTYIYIIIGKNI